MIEHINEELTQLQEWLNINKLTLNIKKTKYMIFSTSQKLKQSSYKSIPQITINTANIERVSKFKFLGVIVTENMKWDEHIDMTAGKLARSSAIICKLKHFLPTNILLNLYNTLCLSHINNCMTVWGHTEASNKNRVILIQKRIIRNIANAQYLDHSAPLFKQLNILPFNQLLELSTIGFMYRFSNSLLPNIFENYFFTADSIHSHNTRQLSQYRIEGHNTALYAKSIKIVSPKLWNTTPTEI